MRKYNKLNKKHLEPQHGFSDYEYEVFRFRPLIKFLTIKYANSSLVKTILLFHQYFVLQREEEWIIIKTGTIQTNDSNYICTSAGFYNTALNMLIALLVIKHRTF